MRALNYPPVPSLTVVDESCDESCECYLCRLECEDCLELIEDEEDSWLITRLNGTHYELCNSCVGSSDYWFLVCNTCGDRFEEDDIYFTNRFAYEMV